MPRKPDPSRRPEILDAVVAYIAEHGIADLSLRPLAKALGQSTYVLTYHFGDKEGLVAAASVRFEEQQRSMLREWSGWDKDLTLGETVRRYWRWVLKDDNLKMLRVGLELASTGADLAFTSRMIPDWIDFVGDALVTRGHDRADARTESTLVVAMISGLLIDYMTTGDRRRTSVALDRFAAELDERLRVAAG